MSRRSRNAGGRFCPQGEKLPLRKRGRLVPVQVIHKKRKGEKMRVVSRILVASLICLPAVAFADVYPLSPPPDLFTDNITSSSSNTFTGTVESITDYGNCSSIPCFANLNFVQTASAFSITDSSSDTYLAGTLVTTTVDAGGEVGEIFDVTTDNAALWSALEGQPASSFGSEVVMDLHDFYFGAGYEPDATSDFTPYASVVPEPASLTLLLSGLAVGYVRKRIAGKKS